MSPQLQKYVRETEKSDRITKIIGYISLITALVWVLFFGWLAATANAAVLNECNLTADSWDTAATHRSQRGLSGLSGTAKSVSVNIKSNIDCTTPSSSSNYMRLRDSGNTTYVDCVLVEDQFFEQNVSTLAYYNCSDHDISTVNWVIDSGSGGSVACDEGTATLSWGINSSGGCSGYAGTSDTGTDKVYHIYDESYSLDPREDPVTTIDEPDDEDTQYGGALEFIISTDVDVATYPSETPLLQIDVDIYDDDTSTYVAVYGQTSFEIEWGEQLASGYYAFSDDDFILSVEDGTYRIRARSSFDDGDTWGEWTSYNDFYIDHNPYGGGGGGSWDTGDDDGDHEEWETFWAGLPSFSSIYGSCDFFSLSAEQGDGLDCLWDWVQYVIIPPEDYFMNYIQAPIAMLKTKWPFNYIVQIESGIKDNIYDDQSCPMPTIFGTSLMGQSVASVDLCDYFDPIDDYFEANSTSENAIVVIIYFTLGMACFMLAKDFLTH